ncbi:CDP-diacylglycerol--serine O-phosphatidyltransferase [Embiotoca jacksoni]|uniref:CDP-diacylglycerol--serine O-phosphatidyltransferase n=1 Tax=Embiotoca jacksoni TaxID=100190 RepID=UPI0037049048
MAVCELVTSARSGKPASAAPGGSNRGHRRGGTRGRASGAGSIVFVCPGFGSAAPLRRSTCPEMRLRVLLYWPNVVGYVRLGLVLAAWAAFNTPAVFIPLYSVSAALDGVDGWLARRLGQTSRFGAWLDVVVDNLGRGMLWSQLFEWGWLVAALEWCVFVCNHGSRGDQWKESFSSSPALIQAIMSNGFRTPLGVWVVSGLHVLPVWLYACRWGFLWSRWIQAAGTLLLAAGRLLALSAEMWCIWTHVGRLTGDEPEEKRT